MPIYKLLGGAWRTRMPFYASIGRNATRTVDEVVRTVEAQFRAEQPAAIKIRWDGDRTKLDADIPGDIAKARAVRKLVGDGFPLASMPTTAIRSAAPMRVGRALEELGYWWFEEPVQHYHVQGDGRARARLDITVSAGEQTYTLAALADLIDAGVRMVQPDIVKMGGITGLVRCAALAHAHGVELVSHQTQPTVGHLANMHVVAAQMHATKPIELDDPSARMRDLPEPPKPVDGHFSCRTRPGLGLDADEAEFARRRRPLPKG